MLALFTEEQESLRDVVSDLARKIGIHNPSDLETVDRERGWSDIEAMGLLGLRAREDGAPVASGVEVMIVAEALASKLVPQPYLGAALLPAELFALAGAPGVETRACVLLTPDLGGLSTAQPGAMAWDCAGAEVALAVDAASGTVTRHAVTGLEVLGAADLTRTVATAALGGVEDTWSISAADLDRWYAFALVAVTADIVGSMRGALIGAVDYTKERMQFGVPVGSFQAVQHLCSDMLVRIEAAASTLKYAAWAVDELEPSDALQAARTAKAYTAGIAREIGETVMQVYGGIGQTWEHIAHFHLRRQMVSAQVLGGAAVQLRAIADFRLGAA